ncbi:uncharacterized protein G2W53_006678 [Senna tora]|uniref:Uncharacterized protein n=1 Tax=Senna tora TaxID=362788 RepID=A0A835CCR2_9FABA|nr:uncharacterized protein G2W53_006678 [Senna tora]
MGREGVSTGGAKRGTRTQYTHTAW